jgi:hypothetical protein
MSRPTEVELAWFAGIVDGEGTIGLHRTNDKRNPHPYLRPHFQIANTDLRILEKARSIMTAVTGKPHNLVVTNHKRPDGHKLGYRVAANTQTAMVLILPMLIPYLVGKAEQAELVLEFSKCRLGRTGSVKHWYEFKEQDEAIYSRCLQLNRRGEPQTQSAEVIELKRSA